jgi:hypothetical protein
MNKILRSRPWPKRVRSDLLACPPIVVRLLFDAEIVGAGVVMSRLAGIALIGLGLPAGRAPTLGRHSAAW